VAKCFSDLRHQQPWVARLLINFLQQQDVDLEPLLEPTQFSNHSFGFVFPRKVQTGYGQKGTLRT
jgi:hypothetical protein